MWAINIKAKAIKIYSFCPRGFHRTLINGSSVFALLIFDLTKKAFSASSFGHADGITLIPLFSS